MSTPNPAQMRFDKKYITATEVSKEMGVSRPSVLHAKQRGLLPESITVGEGRVCVWEREAIAPHLARWRKILASRKGQNE